MRPQSWGLTQETQATLAARGSVGLTGRSEAWALLLSAHLLAPEAGQEGRLRRAQAAGQFPGPSLRPAGAPASRVPQGEGSAVRPGGTSNPRPQLTRAEAASGVLTQGAPQKHP